jgi:NADH-quinone oxidoreductase subunit C
MMTTDAIFESLKPHFPEDALQLGGGTVGQPWILAKADILPALCKMLRDDPAYRFDVLMCLTGLHYNVEQELGVVYSLDSTELRHKLNLKVRVPEADPRVPSVEKIWKTANWHEREAYDLVGINFENHPDLRRILTPDDWEGHALRKDYVQQEFYQGIPTN